LKKQLSAEDLTMMLQWIVTVVLTPFVLLPLFPRQNVGFMIRLLIVIGVYVGSGVITLIYLRARKTSYHAAAVVVNITAFLDAVLVFAALLIWPRYIPDLFWIFPILVIVIANRFGYKEAAAAAIGLSSLYAITIVSRLNTGIPTRTVIGDTLIRVVFLLLIAVATSFISQRERRERRDARILSGLAASMGATLDVDELMDMVAGGISEAAGLGRCSAFMVSTDRRWALPQSTTEESPEMRERFFKRRIDLEAENVASRAVRTREAIVVNDPANEPLLDQGWIKDFDLSALLVLPFVVREEARGVIFVERRGGLKKGYFLDREVNICNTILSQASAGWESAMRYAEEQRKRSEADIRYRTSRELSSALDIDRVLENACKLAIRSVGCAGCTAFVLDQSSGMLQPALSIGTAGARRTAFPPEAAIPASSFEDMYSLAARPPALEVGEPAETDVLPAFLRTEGSLLISPFFTQGGLTGMLCCTDPGDARYSASQVSQLAAVAGETALAVMNARLHERIKSDAAQMASLVQLANAIGSTADLTTIMMLALETVRHLFDCTSGLIYRIDEGEGALRYVESFGYPRDILDRLASPPYPRVDECWTIAEDRLIGIDDLSKTKVACRTLERIGEGSTMCVGMQAEGKTLGVLHVRSEQPNAFGEQDQQLALAIADQVGLAMQRALLFEEINRLAATDPLTGVFNVRRLEAVLQEEVSRARRYDRSISFLMVDVDNLKAYNDTLGHQQGDIALSQIASIIDSTTRDVDKVFRYGGDEFCVLLPETDSAEAGVVAEKIRRAIADFHFAGEEKVSAGSLTISVGVATFPQDADEERTLIGQADIALYAAKQMGRNSIAIAR
jgi:diguanylate cyclase (GGDEF)-like protein